MEGKATFTLTDARTGRTVKQFTEHNMITDAVKRILDPPDYTLLYNFNYSNYIKNMLPLSQTLFGGIILLGNTMEERTDNVLLNKDCIPIATAGGPYSGTNVRRGTLNQNESYATANGYHFTWDFGTDKANGVIKCAALTSRLFGNTGFSNEDTSGAPTLNPENVSSVTGTSMQYATAEGQYVGTFEKLTHTYFKRISGSTSLEFVRVKSPDPNSIGVNDAPDISSFSQPVSSTIVEIPINYNIYKRWFLDVQTKTLYFFSNIYSKDGQYKVDYAGISMTDYSTTDTGSMPLPYTFSTVYATAYYDEKLFIAGDSKVEIFSAEGVLLKSYPVSLTAAPFFSTVNGVLYFTNGNTVTMAYFNDEFYTFVNPSAYTYQYAVDIKPPYFPSSYASTYTSISGVSQNPYLGLAAWFLSTINNLSEPLEKTSEHALKITYDITN
ncbi:MAG: hypothetical protein ACI4WS_11590 [Oscillospiraceae bacterium]